MRSFLNRLRPAGLALVFFSMLLLLATSAGANSKKFPPKPNPPRLVNDLAGVMSAEEVSTLEQMLDTFSRNTGNQIAVIIEGSMGDAEVRDYSAALAENWGIGQKERRNGVLIYIAIAEKKSSIMVGYGLEPVITDVRALAIRKDLLGPYLKQGQYFQGLATASIALMKLARSEFGENDQLIKEQPGKRKKKGLPFWLISTIFIVIIAIAARRNRNKGGPGSNGGSGGAFIPPLFFGSAFGGSSGGWGGSGGGGGGFGGFGGGGFGGGGSSGSW